MSYNKIIYGAPGVGKSKSIADESNGEKKWVVTFHPEYSYYDFIGGYKPVFKKTKHENIFLYYNSDVKKVQSHDYEQNKLQMHYEFQPGIFLKAYVDAWREYIDPSSNKNIYFVIEELNRGNCAAIFGDIFQLLDRDKHGFSDYFINTNDEIGMYLKNELGTKYEIEINSLLAAKKIIQPDDAFKVLMIPSNLIIIATMNTSDQSLFPIDSAFKRRWLWEYLQIDYEEIKSGSRKIRIEQNEYNWGKFLENINYIIFKLTESEDKCLGPYFIKEDVIDIHIFRGKILYYLWFEVFKDESNDILARHFPKTEKTINGTRLDEPITYSDFYDKQYGPQYIKEFMELNGVAIEGTIPLATEEDSTEEDSTEEDSTEEDSTEEDSTSTKDEIEEI